MLNNPGAWLTGFGVNYSTPARNGSGFAALSPTILTDRTCVAPSPANFDSAMGYGCECESGYYGFDCSQGQLAVRWPR